MSRPPSQEWQGLSSRAVLDLWDRGRRLGAGSRALEILEAAGPKGRSDTLRGLTVGQRDSALLSVRALTFGAGMTAVVECERCSEQVEVEFRAEDIGLADTPTSAIARTCIEFAGHQVVLRPLTAGDLCDAETLDTPDAVRELLLRRAVVSVDNESAAIRDDGLADRVEEELEALDNAALIEVALSCAVCEHRWTVPFDATGFLWEELGIAARRLLAEVAELASAFHWSEADILSMSDLRRRHYLEIARSWQAS